MKSRFLWLLTAVACLLAFAACAEDWEGFDLAALENDETITSFLDDNGIDTVYRSENQPFFGETDDGEVYGFLDYVELANGDLVVIRFTLAMNMEDELYADTMTLRFGDRAWTWSVTTRGSEYDSNYQEDYSVYLVGDGWELLEALAKAHGEKVSFTLLGYRTVIGTVTVDAAEAGRIRSNYVSLGGLQQDLTRLEERWNPAMD